MSTTRLDRILASAIDHADKAPTFVQRLAWTMLARSVATAADRAEARLALRTDFVHAALSTYAAYVETRERRVGNDRAQSAN